jgi:hypothetical protein
LTLHPLTVPQVTLPGLRFAPPGSPRKSANHHGNLAAGGATVPTEDPREGTARHRIPPAEKSQYSQGWHPTLLASRMGPDTPSCRPPGERKGPLWLDSCAKSFKRSWSGSDCGSGPCSENGVIPRLLLLPCLAGVLAGTSPRPSDCQWMVPRHGKSAASTSRVRVAGGSPPAIREPLLLPRRSDRPSPPTGPDRCRGKSLPRRPIPSRRWSHRWFYTVPCY